MMAWEVLWRGERASKECALFGTTLLVMKVVPIKTGLCAAFFPAGPQRGSSAEVKGAAWSLIVMKFL